MGVIHMWPQMYGYELTPQEFLFAYCPFGLFGEKGFISFTARLGKKIIDKIPTSNKGWKTRFFLASSGGSVRKILRGTIYPAPGLGN